MKSIGVLAWAKRLWRRVRGIGTIGIAPSITRPQLYDTPYLEINGRLQAENRAVRFIIDPIEAANGPTLRVRVYAENLVSTCGECDEIYGLLQDRANAELHIMMGGSGRRIVATGRIVNAEMIAEAGKTTVLRYEFDGMAHRATSKRPRLVTAKTAA